MKLIIKRGVPQFHFLNNPQLATTNEPLGGAHAHLTNLQKSDLVYMGPNYAFLQRN